MAAVLARGEWGSNETVGLCFLKPADVGQYTTSHLLINILGSMTQYQGRSQGLLFDPESMDTLVSSYRQHVNTPNQAEHAGRLGV